jgi:hypothetical protein
VLDRLVELLGRRHERVVEVDDLDRSPRGKDDSADVV